MLATASGDMEHCESQGCIEASQVTADGHNEGRGSARSTVVENSPLFGDCQLLQFVCDNVN